MAAGSGGSGVDRMVWKEEEMYRWQFDATAEERRDLLGKPKQEVKFEFKQSMETGGQRFSWRAWARWGMLKPSSSEIRFSISLQTLNSEGAGGKSLPEERVSLKVENAVGTKIFDGGPCIDTGFAWRDEIRGTYYSWTKIFVIEETFNELQTHGGGMIVTFILKTDISTMDEIYWPSEIAIKDNFYTMISKLENDDEKNDLKIISSDGKEFFACRWILAHVSEVFEAMFRCDMRERQSGVRNLDDLSGTTVKILLHFIHTGAVVKEWSCAGTVEELMYAADKYQIEELKNFLDAKLGAICTVENAGALLAMAEKTSLKKAVVDILAFIKDPKIFFEVVKNTKTD